LEKVKIEISIEVIGYLNELIKILFEKEYFSFEESAQLYVKDIYDFIEFELYNLPHKTTTHKIKNFGSKYVCYKANKRTTWYIFFTTHITNNHMQDINVLNE
jgi:hypothetical protein